MGSSLYIILVGTLVYQVIAFLKFLRAKDVDGFVTIATAWAAGVAVTFLFRATTFADKLQFGDKLVRDFTTWDTIFFGLLATSILAVVYDFKKAVDGTDSAETPGLVTGRMRGGAATKRRGR